MINRNKPCIELDDAGPGGHLRYTEWPTGRTLIRQPFYHDLPDARWVTDRTKWLVQVPRTWLIVNPAGEKVCSVGELVDSTEYHGPQLRQ